MPFMRFLSLIVILAVFSLALIFNLQNQEQKTTLTLVSYRTGPIPVFVIILGSFLVGVIFTSIIGIIEGMKMRVANARLKRKSKRLQSEVDALRNLPLSGPADEGAPPETPADDEDNAL